MTSTGTTDATAGPAPRERQLVVAGLVGAAGAVATVAWATATRTHAFWAFALWVGFMVLAVVTGVLALVRLPRSTASRGLRRLALLAVVVGIGCATLGLAVYSASRSGDCPTDGSECTIPAPGPGQRPQLP